MKDIGWIILGGGALYLLYEMGFFGSSATTTVSTSTSPQANTSTSVSNSSTVASTNNNSGSTTAVMVPIPGGGSGSVPMPTTLAALKAYVHSWALNDPNFVTMASGQYAGQLMSDPYHWNFYVNYGYPPSTGNPINTSMFAGTSAASGLANAITEAQFWAAVGPTLSSYGLSGFGGMGLIANHVNPYMQGPRGGVQQIYGANLAPTGPERMIRVRSNG